MEKDAPNNLRSLKLSELFTATLFNFLVEQSTAYGLHPATKAVIAN